MIGFGLYLVKPINNLNHFNYFSLHVKHLSVLFKTFMIFVSLYDSYVIEIRIGDDLWL